LIFYLETQKHSNITGKSSESSSDSSLENLNEMEEDDFNERFFLFFVGITPEGRNPVGFTLEANWPRVYQIFGVDLLGQLTSSVLTCGPFLSICGAVQLISGSFRSQPYNSWKDGHFFMLLVALGGYKISKIQNSRLMYKNYDLKTNFQKMFFGILSIITFLLISRGFWFFDIL